MEVWENYVLQKMSDIKIKVGDNVYDLHNIVLSISPFFFSMLNGNFSESTKEIITLDFVNTEIWIYILRYLYNRLNLTNIYNIKGTNFDISSYDDNIILQIKDISDLLLLGELSQQCSDILDQYLDTVKSDIDDSLKTHNYDMLNKLSLSFDDQLYVYLIKKISNLSFSNLFDLVHYFYLIPASILSLDKDLWRNILHFRYPDHKKTKDPLHQLITLLEVDYDNDPVNVDNYVDDNINDDVDYIYF